jgi:class 3 adenylate cyclase
LFEQAIARATETRFLHIGAIAAELAARVDFAQGNWSQGRRRVESAIAAYSAWGATGKVQQLQSSARWEPGSAQKALAAAVAPKTWRFQDLDQLAFDRFVSNSGELGSIDESNKLFERLLRHVMENAGATNGSLLCVGDDHELFVVAHGHSGAMGVEANASSAVQAEDVVSQRLVHYAMRAQSAVSFPSPHRDTRFAECPRLSRRQPASVLCLPLRAGVQVIGALYLENEMLRDAFVLERMPFLPVLSRQLAIVLQNVRSLHVLDQRTRSLHVATETMAALQRVQSQLNKFVPRSVREGIAAHPEGTAFAAHEEDLTVLFVDIAGYTALTERIGSSRAQKVVECYFADFLDAIESHSGDVNEMAGDGMMAIFRADVGQAHALQAVAAASAIQASAARLNAGVADPVHVKVGVASGVATIGAKRLEGRTETRWTWTATGSVTNLAARLVQAGEGSDVLLSNETMQRIAGQWDTTPIGVRRFKGFDHAVAIFRLGLAHSVDAATGPAEWPDDITGEQGEPNG